MPTWQYVLLLVLGLLMVLGAVLAPERFFRIAVRLALNAAAGLALLVALGAVSRWSGLVLPLNGLTLATSCLLGAPGIVSLAVLAAI